MPTFALMKQEKETNSPSLHLQQQQLLLRMEYEYEKEEFRRQTETMGVARKVKRGMCWFPVTTGRSYYNSLNQLVLEVTRTEDTDIEHNFEYGRPVCFFRQTTDGRRQPQLLQLPGQRQLCRRDPHGGRDARRRCHP